MALLSDDAVFSTLLRLDGEDILKLCDDPYFSQLVCNENFWKTKFNQDYPQAQIQYPQKWVDLYANRNAVLYFEPRWIRTDEEDIYVAFTHGHPPYAIKASRVNYGPSHELIIDQNGGVWGRGIDNYGALGPPRNKEENLTLLSENWKFQALEISSGANHTVMIDTEHNLIGMGSNRMNQLGDKVLAHQTPIPTLLGVKAKAVSCGENSTAVIDLDDNVLVVGNNSDGQLGLGDAVDRSEFTTIPDIKAKTLGNSERYLSIIDSEDHVWVAGPGYPQLTLLVNYAVKSLSWCNTIVHLIADDNTLTTLDVDTIEQYTIDFGPNELKQISAGYQYSLLRFDNETWLWNHQRNFFNIQGQENRFENLPFTALDISTSATESLIIVKELTAHMPEIIFDQVD